MNKINILSIIVCHIKTLRDGDSEKISASDFIVFYALPAAVIFLLIFFKIEIPEKAMELSISIFSIFAALLLSVQVAIYSVSLREISAPDDQKKKGEYENRLKFRKRIIKELNDNVSYLILLSVVAVTVTLLSFVACPYKAIVNAIATAIYIHFFLTIIMVVKRASIVFSREYEDGI